MNKKKGKIIEEFANSIFVITSVLSAFFAGVLIEKNTGLASILLFIAVICGCISLSYNDEEVIRA